MRVNVPLIGELAIIQGETYQALSLEFPGDLTDWTPRGQIRTKLLAEGGTLLAAFEFEASTFDQLANITTVNPRLSAIATAAIPKTKWQGTGEYSKTAVYYYDIELESDTGEVVKSVPAIVQVIGEVTGPGIPPAPLETFVTEAPQDGFLYGRQDGDWLPVGSALGDMSKIDYDTNNSGVVDNSERLNNELPAFYLSRTNHTGIQSISTISGLQTALDSKQSTLVSGTNIKSINNESLVGSGNLTITGGLTNPIDTVFQTIQTVTYNQSGTSTLNNATHNVFALTANGTGTTIAHSNVPASGNRYGFELHLNWTSGTITWPASWSKGDSPPTVIGRYVITGVTVDGGVSWKIAILAE